jgi:hypothetical protein
MFTKWSDSSLYFQISLLTYVNLHFDSKGLNKHIYCVIVFCSERNYYVCILHGWFDEVVISRFYKFTILRKDINYCATSFINISLNSACKADIVRSEHKYFQVHHISKSLLEYGVDAFKHDYWSCFDCLHHVCSLMSCKVISWYLTVMALYKFINFLKC